MVFADQKLNLRHKKKTEEESAAAMEKANFCPALPTLLQPFLF